MTAPIPKMSMVTQIIYLDIPPDQHLDELGTQAGNQWSEALDLVSKEPGYEKLYWGRRLEQPEKVQLHIEWDTVQHASAFVVSSRYQSQFLPIVKTLTGGNDPLIRHATLRHQALNNPLGPTLLGYPIGTAIYQGTDAAWHEGAWPLWTHVVRHVDGCKGIVGGSVLEPVEDIENGYLVFVAWESVKHHDDYHHSEHFQRHFVILNIGLRGWTEYGHVVFKEIRDGKKDFKHRL